MYYVRIQIYANRVIRGRPAGGVSILYKKSLSESVIGI